MSVRPLDLQVNMNSLIETSRDQAARQATILQEQRVMDGHIVDDSLKSQQKVNKSDKPAASEQLDDTEKHFGTRTEAETEQQYSADEKKGKKIPPTPEQLKEEKKENINEHIVDYLV